MMIGMAGDDGVGLTLCLTSRYCSPSRAHNSRYAKVVLSSGYEVDFDYHGQMSTRLATDKLHNPPNGAFGQ